VDQSKVIAFLQENGPTALERCNLRDWRVFFNANGNVQPEAAAECEFDPLRHQARITLNPDEVRDEEHARELLHHEIGHILLSPLKRLMEAIKAAELDKALTAVLERTYDDAVEEATTAVGFALYKRSTPEPGWERGRAI
jgi:hypothetical protein